MVAQHTAKASWLRAQKLELTSAGSPTPRSCSRPLSPRTEVRREDPKGSDTVRRPPSVHEPKLAHSIHKETRVSLRIRIRLPTGRPAQADTYDRRESSAKHPRNQPGTHTSTGHRPRGFRQNITDTQPLTISIADVNEAPRINGVLSVEVSEDVAVNTALQGAPGYPRKDVEKRWSSQHPREHVVQPP